MNGWGFLTIWAMLLCIAVFLFLILLRLEEIITLLEAISAS
jgi:hypothetical protein